MHPPGSPHPSVHTLHIPQAVNMMEFTPIIRLCYLAQLTLRQGDYSGGLT